MFVKVLSIGKIPTSSYHPNHTSIFNLPEFGMAVNILTHKYI